MLEREVDKYKGTINETVREVERQGTMREGETGR